LSMSEPNLPIVLRRKFLSMGVPVKPMNVAPGSASRIFAASRPYGVRCASSIITKTFSAVFSGSPRPRVAVTTSSNFWIVVMIVRPAPVVSS